jgi:chromosomal replication initiator protein
MNNEQVWQAVLGEIEINLSRANFITWFKDTFISSFENNKVIVCVPNAFVKKWLEEKYHKNILSALKSVSNQNVEEIIYKIELKKSNSNNSFVNKIETDAVFNKDLVANEERGANVVYPSNNSSAASNVNRFGLNAKYLFENFVVGKGNELAHAACLAVVNNLGKSYNPLIYLWWCWFRENSLNAGYW